jgi:hypothetical protein
LSHGPRMLFALQALHPPLSLMLLRMLREALLSQDLPSRAKVSQALTPFFATLLRPNPNPTSSPNPNPNPGWVKGPWVSLPPRVQREALAVLAVLAPLSRSLLRALIVCAPSLASGEQSHVLEVLQGTLEPSELWDTALSLYLHVTLTLTLTLPDLALLARSVAVTLTLTLTPAQAQQWSELWSEFLTEITPGPSVSRALAVLALALQVRHVTASPQALGPHLHSALAHPNPNPDPNPLDLCRHVPLSAEIVEHVIRSYTQEETPLSNPEAVLGTVSALLEAWDEPSHAWPPTLSGTLRQLLARLPTHLAHSLQNRLL